MEREQTHAVHTEHMKPQIHHVQSWTCVGYNLEMVVAVAPVYFLL